MVSEHQIVRKVSIESGSRSQKWNGKGKQEITLIECPEYTLLWARWYTYYLSINLTILQSGHSYASSCLTLGGVNLTSRRDRAWCLKGGFGSCWTWVHIVAPPLSSLRELLNLSDSVTRGDQCLPHRFVWRLKWHTEPKTVSSIPSTE